MSVIKSFSVGNGDMFYIKHDTDNFTIIDCNLIDDVKDDISIIGRSFGYKINDYLEDYGSIKRPIDVGLDKLKEISILRAKEAVKSSCYEFNFMKTKKK